MTPLRPIAAEPDQRYWRAKANRRVRKARFARQALRWGGILLLNATFAAALVFMGLRGLDRLKEGRLLALQHVELEGAQRASAESILAALERLRGRCVLDLDLVEVERIARSDPWVGEASVQRVLPRTLRVRLVERRPAARALIGGRLHVVDGTGYVVGLAGEGAGAELPVITGLEELEEEELARALREGARLIDRLRSEAASFAQTVAELDLSGRDRVTARTRSTGPLILLDPARIERNVDSYLELRPAIRRLGSIEYVDLRWEDRISVMPAGGFDGEDG